MEAFCTQNGQIAHPMASPRHEQPSGSIGAAIAGAGRMLILDKYSYIDPPIGEGSFAKVAIQNSSGKLRLGY